MHIYIQLCTYLIYFKDKPLKPGEKGPSRGMGKGDLLKARNLKRYINQVFLNYDIKMVTLMCIKNFAYHVKNFIICVDHYLSCNETKKMYGFSFHFCSAYYCKSAQ